MRSFKSLWEFPRRVLRPLKNQTGPLFALVSVTISCGVFEGLQPMFKGAKLDTLLLLLASSNPSHSGALASVTPSSAGSLLRCRLLLLPAFTTDAGHLHRALASRQSLAK